MKKIKGAFKSKTIIFATMLSFLGPVLDAFPNLKGVLGDNYGIAFAILAGVVGYLRFVTTKPLDEK